MALTGQAPFNRYSFKPFPYSTQTPDVGRATVTEGSDTAAGVGGTSSVLQISALNNLKTGPQSRFNKFRQFTPNSTQIINPSAFGVGNPTEGNDVAVGVGAGSTSGSAAITEGTDTSLGVGGAGSVLVSSLNSLTIGPKSRFNRFKSDTRSSQVIPLTAVTGTGAITEGNDAAAGAGSAIFILPVSSLNPANLGPGQNAPFNLNQFSQSFAFSTDTGIAAITEGADVASGSGGVANVGSAAITEGADISTGFGGAAGSGVATITESADTLAGSGSGSTSGSGAAIESPDIAAGSGGPIGFGSAAITEGHDAVAGSGATSIPGSAAAVESADVALGIGGIAGIGSGILSEAPDTASGAGNFGVTGAAAITETPDTISAGGGASGAGAGATTEGSDTAAGIGGIAVSGAASIAEAPDTSAGTGATSNVGAAQVVETPDYAVGIGSGSAGGVGGASIVEGRDVANAIGTTPPVAPILFGWAEVIALSHTGYPGAMSAYIESSAAFINASWFDTNGNPLLPAEVRYRIDDLASGQNIQPWMGIQPALVNQVTVTSLQNAMISQTRDSETHQVLFQVTDPAGNVAYADVQFYVLRVVGA